MKQASSDKKNNRQQKPTPNGALAPKAERLSFRGWLKQNWIALLVLALAAAVFVGLYVYSHQGQIYQNQSTELEYLSYETATVLNVSRDTVTPDRLAGTVEIAEVGSQTILIRVTSGEFEGQTFELENYVSVFNGTKLATGDNIVVAVYAKDGAALNITVYQYDRVPEILWLLVIFFLIVVLVGGKTGLKSLLGLVVTVICLIWILCPLLMKGFDPAWTALGLCVYVEIICFTLLDGINKKTLSAMVGTAVGMGLAALFGVAAQAFTRINSYSMYTTSTLVDEFRNIQQQGIPLRIHGLLTAGIIISSLGAVMDVAMSLSSAISELKTVNPSLTFGQLLRSGMRIGRDMVGTMTNTLVLAFVGSSLLLIIYMWSLELSFHQLLSSSFLAVELISALSSSVGVVLAVPLTALVGAAMFEKTAEK